MILDWLIAIPGPVFLLIFIVYSALVIGFSWYLIRKDDTENLELPNIKKLDYYTIAYLKENWQGVARLGIFRLLKEKSIEITSSFLKSEVVQTSTKKKINNKIEQILYSFIGSGRNIKTFFSSELGVLLSEETDKLNSNLRSLNLLKSEQEERRATVIRVICGILVFILGGLKFFIGAARGKPVGFLIILLIIDLFAVLLLLNSKDHKTHLGRRYLQSLEEKFESKKDILLNKKDLGSFDPSIYVALFGTSILAGFAGYELYNSQFRNPSAWSGNSGGCGGGCGGGGGGCGGGCGGCGGCG